MCACDVLVIEDEVGPPHQAAGDVNHLQAVIVLFIPLQVRIVPPLPDPQVGNQHLVPLILKQSRTNSSLKGDHRRLLLMNSL